MNKKIIAIIAILVCVISVSGCGSALSCTNCTSGILTLEQKITADQNGNIICGKCGALIPCPECKGKLTYRKLVDSNGTHDQAYCAKCNKAYNLT